MHYKVSVDIFGCLRMLTRLHIEKGTTYLGNIVQGILKREALEYAHACVREYMDVDRLRLSKHEAVNNHTNSMKNFVNIQLICGKNQIER